MERFCRWRAGATRSVLFSPVSGLSGPVSFVCHCLRSFVNHLAAASSHFELGLISTQAISRHTQLILPPRCLGPRDASTPGSIRFGASVSPSCSSSSTEKKGRKKNDAKTNHSPSIQCQIIVFVQWSIRSSLVSSICHSQVQWRTEGLLPRSGRPANRRTKQPKLQPLLPSKRAGGRASR